MRSVGNVGQIPYVAAAWVTEFIQFLAVLSILNQDDFKKRINRTATWRNGCFEKMDDHPVHTTTNHHPTKWMFSQKLFFKPSMLTNG